MKQKGSRRHHLPGSRRHHFPLASAPRQESADRQRATLPQPCKATTSRLLILILILIIILSFILILILILILMQLACNPPPWLGDGGSRRLDVVVVLDGEHRQFADGRTRPSHQRPGILRPSNLRGQIRLLGILIIIILTILIMVVLL